MSDEPADLGAPVHLEYTLSSRELRRAWWSAFIRSPVVWFALVPIAVISAILLLVGAVGSAPSSTNTPASVRWLVGLLLFPFVLLSILLVMAFVAVVLLVALAAITARQLGRQELLVDDAQVVHTTARGEDRPGWRALPRARELGSAYMLGPTYAWSGGRTKILIPKRAFDTPASEERFRVLCSRHCKAKLRGRPPVPDGPRIEVPEA